MRRTLSETTDNALPGSPLQEEPSEMSESFQDLKNPPSGTGNEDGELLWPFFDLIELYDVREGDNATSAYCICIWTPGRRKWGRHFTWYDRSPAIGCELSDAHSDAGALGRSFFVLLPFPRLPRRQRTQLPELLSFPRMDASKNRYFHARKFMTRHQYKGRRSKRKRRALATRGSSAARPSHGNSDAPDLDCSSFIRSVDDFVNASEQKLQMFDDESKRQDERGSTFICEIDAMQNLVSGAVCPNCGRCELSVRESAEDLHSPKWLQLFDEFLKNQVPLTATHREEVFVKRLGQSQNPAWPAKRTGRLTASNFCSALHCQKPEGLVKEILYPRNEVLKQDDPRLYGLQNEARAVQEYANMMQLYDKNTDVEDTEVHVHEHYSRIT
ncbi:hypothetical protein HPB49_007746 [Dermacentor silvarum]|uniref:Uncharacterized protein n=1 Tax=Dermacentor silvarum TaxID=543639 RepID=A0ACB8CDQ5_DERSI|nr:hypothetical protein HPB49_007746 [Dermacentor silvarum]